MHSMNDSNDESAQTNLPSWQTEPCPSWCTWAPHEERTHPEDRFHTSVDRRRNLPLERPAEVEPERWESEYLAAYLWQHEREVEATITVCKGESNEGFRLTLSDAEAVAAMLNELVAEARRG
jgi:hypothetical protein